MKQLRIVRTSTTPVVAWLFAVISGNAQGADGCPAGLFGVAAQIVRIEPAGSPLFKRLPTGKLTPVNTNDVICAGESLEVKAEGRLRSVELYARGRKQELTPGSTFDSRQGVLAYSTAALEYLAGLVGGVGDINPPPNVPGPTAVRGDATQSGAAPDVTPLRALRGLPRQNLVAGTSPVLSWRGGSGPYICLALSDVAKPVSSSTVPESASWCVADGNLTRAVQLQVRDAKGQRTSWNIQYVAAADVPRPAWLPPLSVLSPADQTAWAAWLWTRADKVWRLHALAMLNALAETEWSAGYIRDIVLAEAPSLSAQ